MFSQFNANADATKPLGVVMLQHDLLQGALSPSPRPAAWVGGAGDA